jgi:imidazolonepropionase-like amidohydrolase
MPMDPSGYDLIIKRINVVDIENDQILSDRTVFIRDGRIEHVVDFAPELLDSNVEIIEGDGLYLVPGFWDNHVHFRGGDELIDENKNLLPLFIANGVTSVRDGGGDITDAVLEWRELIAIGELTGPKIYTSGPKLDGPNGTWEGSIEISSPSEVKAAIDSLESLGVDYVKIYDSTISGEVFLAIIDETEKRGLPVTGHMPYTVLFGESVDRGLDATEHMYYVLKGSSADEEEITEEIISRQGTSNPLGFWEALDSILATFDEKKADSVYINMAEKGTGAVPTLHIGYTLSWLKDTDHSGDEYLNYIGPGIKQTYNRRLNAAMRSSDAATQRRRALADTFADMVPEMAEAGVSIMAGSDSGPFNTFVYPGISLHSELEAMVDAGLSPAQALRTSAPNGAAFFGEENNYGSIEAGYVADLVILNENPLDDIRNTRTIHTVIINGKNLFTKADLEGMLQSLRDLYSQ